MRAFALVDRETIPDERDPTITTETIRLHRLVRAVASGRLKDDAAGAARHALIKAMAEVYPREVYNDPGAWPRARRLDALALDLVSGATTPPEGAETSASYLLDRLASYRQGALAAYVKSRALFERALAIREEALGPEHPEVATSLNNLAGLLQDEGDLVGARPLYERALAIREKTLGPEHPDTATSLGNLASLLQALGDLAGARPLHERTAAILEKALGPEHPWTATSLNNLGRLLQDQGDLPGARTAHRTGLDHTKESPGRGASRDEHHSGQSRIRLARPRRAFRSARSFRTGARGAEKVLGPDHPWTKASAGVVARALGALSRADEAAAVRAHHGIGDGPAA